MILEVSLVYCHEEGRIEKLINLTNEQVFYLNQSLPFGGTKSSGHGRFAGKEGLLGLCSPKAITEDRFHASLQTGIPPLLAYPINSGEAAWQFVNGLVRMAYAMTWREKGKGLWQLVMAGKLD